MFEKVRFVANIRRSTGALYYIGTFDSAIEAAVEYAKAAAAESGKDVEVQGMRPEEHAGVEGLALLLAVARTGGAPAASAGEQHSAQRQTDDETEGVDID